MSHIKQKLVAIVDPRSRVNMEAVQDGDLFGPILICLALGTTLLLRGQVHFGEPGASKGGVAAGGSAARACVDASPDGRTKARLASEHARP